MRKERKKPAFWRAGHRGETFSFILGLVLKEGLPAKFGKNLSP